MKLQTRWKAQGELFRKLLAMVASFASMAGLLFVFLPPAGDLPWWAIALLVSALFFLIVLIMLEFFDRRGRRVYAKTDSDGIKKYMHDWIQHGGRVAIWTRDMSWAQNPETSKLLTEKAKLGELVICLPELNAFAEQLASAGADVHGYGEGYFESPASRFTIAFFGRAGARVAVGRAEGDVHVIDEFSAGGHPAFHLAADLVALVRSLQQNRAS